METNDLQQTYLLKLLVDNLAILKSKNPQYSLRSYSRKLGISPAALSEMMSGKRLVSSKTSIRIFDRLNVSPAEKEKLKKLERNKKALEKVNQQFLQLEMDQYHIISDWFYFAILSLAETPDFSDRPAWIAQRLNITVSDAKNALARLERLKLLQKNSGGVLACTGASFKTTTDISSASLRKSHSDNLELAKQSLERDDVTLRDFSSMTMAINPELLPEAKKLIKDFRRKLTQFLESDPKQEVYKLNIQLFPVSNVKETL